MSEGEVGPLEARVNERRRHLRRELADTRKGEQAGLLAAAHAPRAQQLLEQPGHKLGERQVEWRQPVHLVRVGLRSRGRVGVGVGVKVRVEVRVRVRVRVRVSGCTCCSTASIMAASLSLARKRVSCARYVLMLCWCRFQLGHWSGRSMPDLERTGAAAAAAPPAAWRRKMPSMCERQSCTSRLNTWPAGGEQKVSREKSGCVMAGSGGVLSLSRSVRRGSAAVRHLRLLDGSGGPGGPGGLGGAPGVSRRTVGSQGGQLGYRSAAGTAARRRFEGTCSACAWVCSACVDSHMCGQPRCRW